MGSGICLVIERDPIICAKEVASVDHLSGGRMELGVGAGWNREEMRNHGTDPRHRMAVMRERVEAMKAIWTQEEASYSGEHVAFERIWSHPKPLQRPHPPVLVGGNGPTVLDRVLGYGDGWFPQFNRDATVLDRVAELFARAERPTEVHVIGMPADPAALERARAAGVRRGDPLAAIGWAQHGRAGARGVGGRDRGVLGRMTGEEARRRFAAAPVARLATADAAGRPHLVPFVFVVVQDTTYSAVDDKPKRSRALRRLANVEVNLRVAALADHYEEDWRTRHTRRRGRRRVACP